LLVLVFEVCSLDESPLGELLLDDDECSLVEVAGATATAGAAITIGGGATTTGAATTIGGAGTEVVVSLVELEVSVDCANPAPALANRAAILKDTAAVLNRCFIMISP
jgi:hypothetical protein